ARILIDGHERGTTPVRELRVMKGTHHLRVEREGQPPIEEVFDVVAGQKNVVTVHPQVPASTARLAIVERSGRVLGVFVEGAWVGVTPWTGDVAPGDHVVFLDGEGVLGTPPIVVSAPGGETTTVELSADKLDARLRVKTTPPDARVTLDGVPVGRGT